MHENFVRKIIFPIGTSVPAQKFAKQVGRPHIVMAEKAGIQVNIFLDSGSR
jgi:hypothetical protein